MTAIVRVTDGITQWHDSQLNQYADALNNILGITDTSQSALGRIIMPQAAAAPGSPSAGQVYYDTTYQELGYYNGGLWKYVPWHVGTIVPPAYPGRPYYRTDEGGAGRFHIRDNAGQEVPYIPLRQYVESAELAAVSTITGAVLTDVGGLSLSITTTGGRLLIGLRPSNIASLDGYISMVGPAAGTGVTGSIRAVVGAQNLGIMDLGYNGAGFAASNYIFYPAPSSLQWTGYKPAAGTYTVKIQAAIIGGGTAAFNFYGNASGGLALYCMELAD